MRIDRDPRGVPPRMRQAARLALTALLLAATPARTASACLWDSDTLRMEARAFPGLAEILTGRIEREPPRYYEMRIERVRGLLATESEVLEHYDDLAVACDRLGRSDEAIAWMERKAQMLTLAEERAAGDAAELARVREHRYRYHANLGTFHAHRSIRSAGGEGAEKDLVRARDEIKAAIAINPDAHFGREIYQLAAIEWLIEIRTDPSAPFRSIIQDPRSMRFDEERFGDSTDAAVKGLSGLIVLGDAWQSVDVHFALEQALARRRDASMALLARLRRIELEDAGRTSFHPSYNQPREDPVVGPDFFGGGLEEDEEREVESFFAAARESAKAWTCARERFMLARFAQGIHPDTHGDAFWAGWTDEPPMPSLPDRAWYAVPFQSPESTALTVLACALCAGLVHIGRREWKRRRSAAAEMEPKAQ
jgi:tetratricopeptide (TPR) repeat protein